MITYADLTKQSSLYQLDLGLQIYGIRDISLLWKIWLFKSSILGWDQHLECKDPFNLSYTT